MRYDKIKKASATQDVLELDIESRFNLPSKKITYRTEYFAQLSFDEVMRLDPDTLTKIERVAKIDRIITDFLSSSFAKSMRNSAPVRPPIMRTNVILKEPNFKKHLRFGSLSKPISKRQVFPRPTKWKIMKSTAKASNV